MRYKEYVRLTELLSLVKQGFGVLRREPGRDELIGHISSSLQLIRTILGQEKERPERTLGVIDELEGIMRQRETAAHLCEGLWHQVERCLEKEVEPKIKVVFLPYKAEMWDSLESVYFAALKDDMCDVEVVPIPYYKLSDKGDDPCYEGDLFPEGIPITHYSAYDLATDRPEIVFVHNIYDQYNTLTRVFEEYHTYNLRKHTDMLVYVPYCLFSFLPPKPGTPRELIAYGLPSVANVDKVVLLGDYMAEAAIKFGVPRQKLLPLGSPKIDKLIALQQRGVHYPREWISKLSGRTVFLLDTCLFFFSKGPFLNKLELLIKLLNIPNYVDNSALIWRPHPLLRTLIGQQVPWFLSYFDDLVCRIGNDEYSNAIFDDSPDYFPALMAADVYVGNMTSLMNAYLVSGRPIMLLRSRLSDDSPVSPDAFYYFHDGDWVEVLRALARGQDPNAGKRRGALEGIYSNVDGTSGQKIFEAVKEALLASTKHI